MHIFYCLNISDDFFFFVLLLYSALWERISCAVLVCYKTTEWLCKWHQGFNMNNRVALTPFRGVYSLKLYRRMNTILCEYNKIRQKLEGDGVWVDVFVRASDQYMRFEYIYRNMCMCITLPFLLCIILLCFVHFGVCAWALFAIVQHTACFKTKWELSMNNLILGMSLNSHITVTLTKPEPPELMKQMAFRACVSVCDCVQYVYVCMYMRMCVRVCSR